jgi:hypothetical protein
MAAQENCATRQAPLNARPPTAALTKPELSFLFQLLFMLPRNGTIGNTRYGACRLREISLERIHSFLRARKLHQILPLLPSLSHIRAQLIPLLHQSAIHFTVTIK